MKTKVNWDEELYQNFLKYAILTDREKEVLRLRIMEYTMTEISETIKWSLSTVKRDVDTLLEKYDRVQAKHPDIFPPKRLSEKEQYMNTH